ncbi:molybdopterin converting factor subunit 1 [Maribacter sp. PR1]|uniref:Molybdopterin synthase sulfur carrier subunit n=1 Tax=Maribacter cobaltidurans TaxID=1178778 RepID=A0ABU7IXK6_9FLAO|nr:MULTISPECIES: molybdopterin converting factor subunit 1 [Maribacter]MDC6389861.1 molybdopterin converting factor subunit 1 [Maribacter sp. PR1]MEE1977251.1 molybdopterin converting factor subunit 1 [Maribacter cobaltidurans]
MEILFFGITKDIVGSSQVKLDFENEVPKSVGELKMKLERKYPEFSKLSSLAVAVNSEYADDNVQLQTNDEVAIIPPVSGG